MERDKKPQENQTSGIPIFDALFGLLDRLFKDNATGQVLASRVITVVILFLMAFVWVKGDSIMQVYKESSYENYSKLIQKDKDARFEIVALEQLQIVHVASDADFSAVYSFRPKNFNYFVDLIAYEGKLPDTVDPKNLGGFPIDKTSNEYSKHLSGAMFTSKDEFIYLPTTNDKKHVAHMVSCPYFNLDNVYSGTVAMYWYTEPKYNEDKLGAICGQAVRAIGRVR